MVCFLNVKDVLHPIDCHLNESKLSDSYVVVITLTPLLDDQFSDLQFTLNQTGVHMTYGRNAVSNEMAYSWHIFLDQERSQYTMNWFQQCRYSLDPN